MQVALRSLRHLGDIQEEARAALDAALNKTLQRFEFRDWELNCPFFVLSLHLHSLTLHCLLILECWNSYKVVVLATSKSHYIYKENLHIYIFA